MSWYEFINIFRPNAKSSSNGFIDWWTFLLLAVFTYSTPHLASLYITDWLIGSLFGLHSSFLSSSFVSSSLAVGSSQYGRRCNIIALLCIMFELALDDAPEMVSCSKSTYFFLDHNPFSYDENLLKIKLKIRKQNKFIKFRFKILIYSVLSWIKVLLTWYCDDLIYYLHPNHFSCCPKGWKQTIVTMLS